MSARLPCAASEMSDTVSTPEPVLTLPLPKVTVTTASMVELSGDVTLSLFKRLCVASSAMLSSVVVPDPSPSLLALLISGAASTPINPANASAANADLASIGPLWYSSVQSPPAAALPVASVDAATSALVNRASELTSAAPLLPWATSQP